MGMPKRLGYLMPWLLAGLVGCAGGRQGQGLYPPPPGVSAARPAAAKADDAPGGKLPAEPSLANYLAYAAIHSPGLEGAFNRWRAALEKIPQVQALPDPMLSYSYYIQKVETSQGVTLEQTFPWFGKLELRGQAAAEDARAARQMYEAEKLRLFQEVKDAYYEYAYLARAVAITQENLDLLQRLEGAVRIRYRAGAAGHPDLVRLQVELGKVENELQSLQDMRQPVSARLAAAINLHPAEALPWPREIGRAETAATDAQMVAWAIESNPQLRMRDAEIARGSTDVELAKKEYFPDVMLGVAWMEMRADMMNPTGRDPVMAMVSVNLPIWREKLRAGVAEARFRRLAAINQKADETNNLIAEIKMASFRYRDANRKVELYGGVLVPKATESLHVNEAAFRAGNAGFTDVIDARRILLEFQLARERALADRAQALANLEKLIARQLPAGPAESRPAPPPPQ